MARLAAVATGLYFPTPLRAVAGIVRQISLPEEFNPGSGQVIRVLDPCAGRGSAALFLVRLLAGANSAEKQRIELFGIELDANRAKLARPIFTRLLQTNTLTARVESKAFDLLFHNPPYHHSGDSDKRLEHAFLKRTTHYLKPGGLLVHIVPQLRLGISAEYLAHYYKDISVYRFPHAEYEAFKQVVLFGVRRETIMEDKGTANKLKAIAELGPQVLPVLNCPPGLADLNNLVEVTGIPHYPEVVEELDRLAKQPAIAEAAMVTNSLLTINSEAATGYFFSHPQPYLLNSSDRKTEVKLFANSEYSAGQALSEARSSGVWTNRNLHELVCPLAQSIGQGQQSNNRPLTPLREGQAAMLTAIGLLNNLVLVDEQGQRVLVKGRTYKEYTLRRVDKDEGGKEKSRTEREVVRSQLTALDLQTGQIMEIEQAEMAAFVTRFSSSIRRQMLANYPPLYVPGQANPTTAKLEAGLGRLGRKPLGGQALAIVAGAYSLLLHNCAIFSAEMGCGKSLMGTAAAFLAGSKRVIVECPPQLVKKWVREIKQTVPGAQAEIVTNIGELRAVVKRIERFEMALANRLAGTFEKALQTPPYFVVISRMDLKLGSRWQAAAMTRPGRNAEGELVRLAYCPRCGSPVLDRDDKPVGLAELQKHKQKCQALRRVWNSSTHAWSETSFDRHGRPVLCNEPLWQTKCSPVSAGSPAFAGPRPFLYPREKGQVYDPSRRAWVNPATTQGLAGQAFPGKSVGSTGNTVLYTPELVQEGPRKIPLAHYIKSHLKGFFDTLIEDELHELKAEGSAQGACAAILAECVKRVISLTGTLSGGKASNLFFLLWRFSREIRQEFRLEEEERWVQRYGIIERTIFSRSQDNEEVAEDGAMSDRREYNRERRVEKPGMNPAILLKLIGFTVFLKLADVARDLPPYEERVVTLPLDGQEDDLTTQAGQYLKLETDLVAAVKLALQNGSSRLLGAMANSLLAWPDNPTRTETVIDPKFKTPVAHALALPEDRLYPKEQSLVDLYRKERSAGRRMLVFLSNTKSRSVVARVKGVLEKAGARVAFLNSDRVKPEDREEWVASQVQAGVDVLLSHPKPIQTGLDLLAWPTLVFWQLQYSTYIMRQASRRSWRIGQKQPVTVYHFVYEGTAQHTGLTLIAKKVRASQMLEGELSNDGLVELAEDGEDGESLMELARVIAGANSSIGKSQRQDQYKGAELQAEEAHLSLEDLFNSLHRQELEAARFVLEDERADSQELEAAIQRIYDAAIGSTNTQTEVTTGSAITQGTAEISQSSGSLPAPEKARQLVLPTTPQIQEVRHKPTLEELRATFLAARQQKLAGNSSKKSTAKVSPQQLSMF